TLLNSDRTLSEENRIAIKKAKEQGVHIVLCTGRPLRSMQHLLQEADLLDDEDIAITYNGGLIQKTKSGEVINELTFNRAECLDTYSVANYLNSLVNFIILDYIDLTQYPARV